LTNMGYLFINPDLVKRRLSKNARSLTTKASQLLKRLIFPTSQQKKYLFLTLLLWVRLNPGWPKPSISAGKRYTIT
jgi:hypothetical protein